MKPSIKDLTRLFLFTGLIGLLFPQKGNSAGRAGSPETMHNAIINSKGELVITPSPTSRASDFDFLEGEHSVHHKKLKERLTGSRQWIEFDGRHTLERVLEGRGNLEQHFMQDNNGQHVEGIALRLFDPQTRLWSIHWSDSRNCKLDVPVVGSFDGPVGYFYASDHFQGRPILIQFKWDATDPEKPVWSQAFSPDRGRTWEWNWFMYFSKPTTAVPVQTAKDSIGVIELRNYVIKHGMRDTFIPFFEQNFVTSQDTLHSHILGRYRVKDKDDNFCWIRGFENMHTRSIFLPAFYHGPVWHKYRNEANAMLANNDNVYLLRPMKLQGDSLVPAHAVPTDILTPQKGVTVVQFFVANSKLQHLLKLFSGEYPARMRSAGFSRYSVWTAELQQNDFPQLPVFQDKNLLVVVSFFNNESEYQTAMEKLSAGLNAGQRADFDDTITTQNTWFLYPTAKSLDRP